jgi:hypothetical protein
MPEVIESETPWKLRSDLAWAHVLLWFARTGRGGEPKRDVHVFMANRYLGLSKHYASRGLRSKAKRLEQKAAWHYRAGSPDPPAAAAMAMPIPQGSSQTSAVGIQEPPDDVA